MEDVFRHIDPMKNMQKKQEIYEPDADGEIEGAIMVMKNPLPQGKIGRQPSS